MRHYYLDQIDPTRFQQLITALLSLRFNEALRATPNRGPDGGSDNETAPSHLIYHHIKNSDAKENQSPLSPPSLGRYVFQVKHHIPVPHSGANPRSTVLNDLTGELERNILPRTGKNRVNYYYLITNISASADAQKKIDNIRHDYAAQLAEHHLHIDVWWYEQVAALLDTFPTVWPAYPEIFPGEVVPMFGQLVQRSAGLSAFNNAIRLTLKEDLRLDSKVRFQQIELQSDLSDLFVDLEVAVADQQRDRRRVQHKDAEFIHPVASTSSTSDQTGLPFSDIASSASERTWPILASLLAEEAPTDGQYILIQGGPGQGKSTVTQMLAQVHREWVVYGSGPFIAGTVRPLKPRVPFRLELRTFADWLVDAGGSLEEYLVTHIRHASGGVHLDVNDIHNLFYESPTLLIFDGLDEIGSEDARDALLDAITQAIKRLEDHEGADIKIVITSRPPAVTSHEEQLSAYTRLSVVPMDEDKIDEYLTRWLTVQHFEESEKSAIRVAFKKRANEDHVNVLATNPMQLAILLHFIRLKGEAFPARRAELYQQYFQIVIDRDVAKNPTLASKRRTIESLHQFVGYKIHELTEAAEYDGSLPYTKLRHLARTWLEEREDDPEEVDSLIAVGEERLCLIVAVRGEAESTSYGFAVQPVREYFAAAYVRNQAHGNAHDWLAHMLRRPFWWEVGMFLAGLSAENERADIIARCVELDSDKSTQVAQIGRKSILALVEEGVLDTPTSTYNQAMSYLLDALIPDRWKAVALDRTYYFKVRYKLSNRITPRLHNYLNEVTEKVRAAGDDSQRMRVSWVRNAVLSCEAAREKCPYVENSHAIAMAIMGVFHKIANGCAPDTDAQDTLIGSDPGRAYLAEAYSQAVHGAEEFQGISIPKDLQYSVFVRTVCRLSALPIVLHEKQFEISLWKGASATWALVDAYRNLMIAGTPTGMATLVRANDESFSFDIPLHEEPLWDGLPSPLSDIGPRVVENICILIRRFHEDRVFEEVLSVSENIMVDLFELAKEPGFVGVYSAGMMEVLIKAEAAYHLYKKDGIENIFDRNVSPIDVYLAAHSETPYWLEELRKYRMDHGSEASNDRSRGGFSVPGLRSGVVGYKIDNNSAPERIEDVLFSILVGNLAVRDGVELAQVPLSSREVRNLVAKAVDSKDEDRLLIILRHIGNIPLVPEYFEWGDDRDSHESECQLTQRLPKMIKKYAGERLVLSGIYAALVTSMDIYSVNVELVKETMWARWEAIMDAGQELISSRVAMGYGGSAEQREYMRALARTVLADSRAWPIDVIEACCTMLEGENRERLVPMMELGMSTANAHE